MKAAWRDRYGGPEVVSVRQIDKPAPAADEILVRVKAASVNRGDLDGLYPRWGFTRVFLGLRAPNERLRRVGSDVAGVVEAVGKGVTNFNPGDDVFSDMSSAVVGSFAEYVCAPSKAFAKMPAGVSHENAACLPHSAIIAIHAFKPQSGRSLGAGEMALIVGASGSVGPFCIQLAKQMGAHVTAVASADKLGFVRSLGADETIDYQTTDYTRPTERYDWVVDVNAHHPVRRWLGALKPGGVYVAFAGSSGWLFSTLLMGPILSRLTGKHLRLGWVRPFEPEDVARLKELVAEGIFQPVIDRRFSLDDVVEALRYVDDGHARGKVLVIP